MASLNLSHIRGNPAFAEFPLTRPVRPSLSSPVSRVGFRVLGQAQPSSSEPDLSVTVNGLHMPNPFVIGSGPPGTNYTVMKRAFDEGWGAVIAKTVSCSYFFFFEYALCISISSYFAPSLWMFTFKMDFNKTINTYFWYITQVHNHMKTYQLYT